MSLNPDPSKLDFPRKLQNLVYPPLHIRSDSANNLEVFRYAFRS